MPGISFKQFLFRMSFGSWLGGQLTCWWPRTRRDEAEGCGGVEAADHQPLGLKGQIGVLCEALLVHATQEAVHVHGGGLS